MKNVHHPSTGGRGRGGLNLLPVSDRPRNTCNKLVGITSTWCIHRPNGMSPLFFATPLHRSTLHGLHHGAPLPTPTRTNQWGAQNRSWDFTSVWTHATSSLYGLAGGTSSLGQCRIKELALGAAAKETHPAGDLEKSGVKRLMLNLILPEVEGVGSQIQWIQCQEPPML